MRSEATTVYTQELSAKKGTSDLDRDIYNQIFEYNAVPNMIVEDSGTISRCNDSFLDLLGYQRGEIEWSRYSFDLVHEMDRGRVTEYFMKRSEDSDSVPSTYECALVKKDGGSVDVLVSVKYIPQFKRRVITCIDISEMKRMEKSLKKSEKRFHKLAEMLPQPLFEVNMMGLITYTNRKGFELFGYSEEDLKEGIYFSRLLAPDEIGRAFMMIRRKIHGEDIPPTEYIAVDSKGRRFPVLIHSEMVREDGEPVGMRGVIVDMSRSKEFEKKLKKEKERSEFYLDMLSHDIGNVHQGLRGYLELALDSASGRTSKYLHKAIDTLDRSDTLIGNVKLLGRMSEGMREERTMKIKDMMQEVKEKVLTFSSGKRVEIEIENGYDVIDTDISELLMEMVYNVVHNSVKHNDKDTARIVVKVEGSKGAGTGIKVSDNGPGFPANIVDLQISEENHAERRDLRRLGSGLPVCFRIAKETGIGLDYRNTPEGAVTEIFVPGRDLEN